MTRLTFSGHAVQDFRGDGRHFVRLSRGCALSIGDGRAGGGLAGRDPLA